MRLKSSMVKVKVASEKINRSSNQRSKKTRSINGLTVLIIKSTASKFAR
ncbi:MAG: hypothetical protein ACI89U_000312 [Gammaproteobacteria bacterium]|jgi:hypothetical protein